MKRIIACSIALVWMAASSIATQSSAAETPTTARFNDSLAVLRIDFAKIDVDAIESSLETLDPLRGKMSSFNQVASVLNTAVRRFTELGVNEVYVTLSASGLVKGSPVVVVRDGDPAAVRDGLTRFLVPPWKAALGGREVRSRVLGDFVVLGIEEVVQELKPAEVIPSLDRLIRESESDSDHTFTITIPAAERGILAAVWPKQLLGESPFAFSPRQVVADCVSLRVDWSFPPAADLTVTAEATDDQAAVRLGQMMDGMIAASGLPSDRVNVSKEGSRLIVRPDATLTAEAFFGGFSQVRRRAIVQAEMGQLKNIGLAIWQYHADKDELPSDIGGSGEERLSWRVALLPYINQLALFREFDTNVAWDEQPRKQLSSTSVPLYANVAGEPASTTLRIPVIAGSPRSKDKPATRFSDITDGTSGTIACAIAPIRDAVPWTKPGYWMLDEDNLLDSFFGDRDAAGVVMYGGTALRLKRSEMTAERLRALLTHAGGEVNLP